MACGQWAEAAAYGAYAVLRRGAFEKPQAGAAAVIDENNLLPNSAALRDEVHAKHDSIIHPPRKFCNSACLYLAARGKSPNAVICSARSPQRA